MAVRRNVNGEASKQHAAASCLLLGLYTNVVKQAAAAAANRASGMNVLIPVG